MTDFATAPSPADQPESKTLGCVAAALFLFFAPAGLILAYIDRSKASPLLASHYNYLIGTFWKGLLFFVISLFLSFVLVGIVASFATSIWYIARCIKSLVYLHRSEAIAQPSTWLV
jgi:Predicted membrane protein